MASNLHLSLVLTSLFFFQLSSARFYLNADDALINTVCRDATDKPFCIQTFKKDPRTPSSDIRGLCSIAVSLIIDQATKTFEKIRGMIDQTPDPAMMNRLITCADYYEDAILKFNEAKAAVWWYPEVLAKIGQGFYNATACDDVFRRVEPIQTSPFIVDTQMLLKLVELPNLVVENTPHWF